MHLFVGVERLRARHAATTCPTAVRNFKDVLVHVDVEAVELAGIGDVAAEVAGDTALWIERVVRGEMGGIYGAVVGSWFGWSFSGRLPFFGAFCGRHGDGI